MKFIFMFFVISSSIYYFLCAQALVFHGNVKTEQNFRESLFKIYPLFTSSSMCLISKDNDMVNFLLESYRQKTKTYIVQEFITSLEKCRVAVVIQSDVPRNCIEINTDELRHPLYIINYSTSPNLTSLNRCLAYSRSPEVVAISLSDSSVFELSSVYIPPRHFVKSSVANVIEHRIKPKTPDLGGGVVIAAVEKIVPFAIIEDESNPAGYDGIEMVILKVLASHLNFTIEYHFYKNWGAMDNNSWVGGIGQAMKDGKADLAFANLWQISSLFSIVDFGPTLSKNKLLFLVRKPELVDFKWCSFLSILEQDVWFATVITFSLVVIVYRVASMKRLQSHVEGWARSVIIIFGYFTVSSWLRGINGSNTRILLSCWLIFTLLLTTLLSSGVFMRLALPHYSQEVNTVRQLVEGHYYWTAQYYARFNNAELRRSIFDWENPWHRQFEKKYVYLEAEEVRLRAESDKKITFPVQAFGRSIIIINTDGLVRQKTLKNFRLAEEVIRESHVSFGVKKRSVLLKPLKIISRKFLESGLLHAWKEGVLRRWPMYDTTHLLHSDRKTPIFIHKAPLRLYKLRPIFHMLLFGLGVATLVFIIEISL